MPAIVSAIDFLRARVIKERKVGYEYDLKYYPEDAENGSPEHIKKMDLKELCEELHQIGREEERQYNYILEFVYEMYSAELYLQMGVFKMLMQTENHST